jgi:gluconolactonase
MTPFVSHRPEFAAVLGDDARLVHIVDADAHEGPVYAAAEHALYVTTLPRPHAQIRRIGLDGPRISTAAAAVTMPNGMTLAPDGRLLVCEQGSPSAPARISRVDPATGVTETVVDTWHGLPLNSPNDVVVKSDGTVWFTDPSYGHLQGFRPEPRVGDFVYRYDPTAGHLSVVADSFDKPNGLAFSPDESVLYVTDSGANQEPGSFHPNRPHHVVAYDVVAGRHLRHPRLFAVTTPGFPDGIAVDSAGRVYVSSSSGVQVFDPVGDLIGEIRLQGAVNFTFGGPDSNVLFITSDSAVWAAVLQATGLPRTDSREIERSAST